MNHQINLTFRPQFFNVNRAESLCTYLNLQKKYELHKNTELIRMGVSVTSPPQCFPVLKNAATTDNYITANYIRKLQSSIIKNFNFSLTFSQFCPSSIIRISKLLGVPADSYAETD